MWELQPLSTTRRTTEISLLLGEKTSHLLSSQIPHNFVGLLSLSHSPLLLSYFSLVVCLISLDALPIYRQASMQKTRNKWEWQVHQLVPK